VFHIIIGQTGILRTAALWRWSNWQDAPIIITD